MISTNSLKQKEILYIVFKDENIRFSYKFYNVPLIVQDDFDGKKIIKWKVVGGYKYPFNSTIQNPIGGIISSSESGKELIFSFENHDGKDYLTLNFFSDEYKLSKGDKVYFMFEKNDVIDFEIIKKPYKSSYNWKKLFETKILIKEEELLKFKDFKLLKWKIDLVPQNEQIHGDDGNDWYNGENYYKVIQKLTAEYIDLVKKEIDNYTPLTENRQTNIPKIKDSDECYVYLMIDTTNSFHKIGISNYPEYREKTLQSDKPTIELFCAKKFPSRKIAESIEKALHSTYSKKRIRGEWFELDENDINEIIKTLE